MGRPHQFIELTEQEKDFLTELVRKGESKAKELNRGRMLLWNDTKKKASEIALLLGISYVTVTQTLKCYRDEGLRAPCTMRTAAGPPARSLLNWRHT